MAIPLPMPALDYASPTGWNNQRNALGCRVLLPWQGGTRVGVVIEITEEPRAQLTRELREVIAVLDDEAIFDATGTATLQAIALKTFAPEGIVLGDFLPWGQEPEFIHSLQLVSGVETKDLPKGTTDLKEISEAKNHDPALLDFLRGQGLLVEHAELIKPSREILRATNNDFTNIKLTEKQHSAYECLQKYGQFESAAEWARAAQVSSGVVIKLIALGAAKAVRQTLPQELPEFPATEKPNLTTSGFAELNQNTNVLRLHGGRNSERHAALAQLIANTDGGVLYIAPDRATLERAWKELGGVQKSAMLDFGLNARLRENIWRAASRQEINVLFGTPMALLAPIQNLKLIVVEEEGSEAYKLQAGCRVFVPDACELRAVNAGAKIIFTGSAPAVETLQHPGLVLPPPRARLHIINYQEAVANEGWPLSNTLKRLLRQVETRGRQAVIVAPRRGYSAVLRCRDCGWIPYCPNCDVPLRYHAETRRIECHQCGHSESPPRTCPNCAGNVFAPRGPGSQWIQSELKPLLPSMPILRFDKDKRDDLTKIFAGEPGIIVGTTAILSQPAPPELALIALSFADSFTSHPDFRVNANYHSLLRQLVEWHPKRAPLLVVQTFQAEHPALTSLLRQEDAATYPQTELASREALHYPPFVHLAQVQVAARKQDDAARIAKEFAALIRDAGMRSDNNSEPNDHEILGPAPAPIARIKGLYAQNILIRAANEERLRQLLAPVRRGRDARVRVDVNPRRLGELLE